MSPDSRQVRVFTLEFQAGNSPLEAEYVYTVTLTPERLSELRERAKHKTTFARVLQATIKPFVPLSKESDGIEHGPNSWVLKAEIS
jgi:hypothetical protein